MNTSRAPKWDRNRHIFLKVGFIMSLSMAFMAFNYTTHPKEAEEIMIFEPDFEELEVTPPIMREKKQLPPVKLSDLVLDILPDEEPEFVETPEPEVTESIIETDPVDHDDVVANEQPAPKKPVVVLPEVAEEPAPLIIAERMPVYNTCDLTGSEEHRRKCTQQEMLGYIYSNLKYPAIARENNISGMVVVSFVVDKEGNIQEPNVMKDIGGGCGAAVLKVISNLGSFYPAKQNGRPVAVIYRIPVKFDLQG